MRRLLKAVRLVGAIGVMTFTLTVGPAWSADLRLVPSAETIAQGETVTVAVEVAGASGLRGYQLDVKYKNEVGKLVKVEEGAFLKSDGTGTFFLTPQGATSEKKALNEKGKKSKPVKTLACSRLGPAPGVSGSGTLAVLTFEGTKKAGKGKPVKNLATKILRKSVILVEDE